MITRDSRALIMKEIEMNDQGYIRTAIELADKWEQLGETVFCSLSMTYIPGFDVPECLDALAAQLVRQVDVLEHYLLSVGRSCTSIIEINNCGEKINKWYGEGPDRTMNTIKAIVDSKVLERERGIGTTNPLALLKLK